jgi:hypothetical protein
MIIKDRVLDTIDVRAELSSIGNSFISPKIKKGLAFLKD